MGGILGTVIAAAAYGAVREKASNALAPLTAKVPLGNISDEVVLGGIAIISKRFIRNPLFHKVADAALIIESARIGEAMIKGQIGLGGAASSGNTVSMYG